MEPFTALRRNKIRFLNCDIRVELRVRCPCYGPRQCRWRRCVVSDVVLVGGHMITQVAGEEAPTLVHCLDVHFLDGIFES